MATAKKKKGQDVGMLAAEIGAGLMAAAGATAAGYYFYASKDAEKNRRKSAKWAAEMKDKVVKETKKQMKVAAKLDRKAVAAIVDRAAAAYQGVRNVKPEDLMLAANELKQNWQELQKELSAVSKKSTTVAKKSVKKSGAAVKKTAKKVAKKVAKKSK